MLRTAFVLLAVMAVSAVFAQDLDVDQETCIATGFAATQPSSLSFCHNFNNQACCIPGHDAENEEFFATMHDVGLSCRLRGDIRSSSIARFYCMNCHPEQPKMVRFVNYHHDDFPDYDKDASLLICNSFAASFDIPSYDRCGLIISAPCQGEYGGIIDDRDRYTCGDDLVIPSTVVGGSTELKQIESFLNYPEFGVPNFDDFGYLVVKNEPCTATEFATALANANADGEDHVNGPNCLMTRLQLMQFYDAINKTYNSSTIVAEQCYDSATTTLASITLLLLSTMLAAIFNNML